jgi:P27 family predicted phage terminase small subunit
VGYSGPPPKPTVIRKAEGNPGKRPFNEREPQPAVVRPRMPKHLNDLAKKEWKRLCPLLERMRVLTEADGIALANLCFDYATLVQAQESLTKTGLLSKSGRSGMIHQSPLLNVVAVTTDRVTRALREFGLTPASRSRIQMTDESVGDDELMELLSRPRVPRRTVVPA